jgi:protein gp37
MAENSKIEWCDHTFNPWIGCQHVSPGCDHCYAESMMDHRYGRVEWGPHGKRVRTSEANWQKPLKWNEHAKAAGVRARVFCASLADWLDNKVPQQWRCDLAPLIKATPHLDWLLLTKRIENYDRFVPWVGAQRNVWLGVTCESQRYYKRRWHLLSEIPAQVRFISYEPALGLLDLAACHGAGPPDWVICGGESGPRARLMNPGWARYMRDQCRRFDVAFFMKQMTQKQSIPSDLLVRQFPKPQLYAAA